jgi:hypothetical protein
MFTSRSVPAARLQRVVNLHDNARICDFYVSLAKRRQKLDKQISINPSDYLIGTTITFRPGDPHLY